MKNYAMFNFDYLFGDHFDKVSAKAKLLYINLSFYANAGFVSNPKQICRKLGYDESVIDELISINEILSIPERSEVFLTSYYIHNPNFNPLSWTKTPYASYWKGKLWMKKNRVATFSKQKAKESMEESPVEELPSTEPIKIDPTLPNSAPPTNPLRTLDLIDTQDLPDDAPF